MRRAMYALPVWGKPRPSVGEGESSSLCPPGHIDLERNLVLIAAGAFNPPGGML